jgi:hypothetical protein
MSPILNIAFGIAEQLGNIQTSPIPRNWRYARAGQS